MNKKQGIRINFTAKVDGIVYLSDEEMGMVRTALAEGEEVLCSKEDIRKEIAESFHIPVEEVELLDIAFEVVEEGIGE